MRVPPRASASGFTVIELLLAISVTAVLAALIVSAYRTYSVRGEVTAGVDLASAWRIVVEQAFRRSGQVPANWAAADVRPQLEDSVYVEAIDLVDGRLDVTFGHEASAAIAGRRLSLTPYETAGLEIVWI